MTAYTAAEREAGTVKALEAQNVVAACAFLRSLATADPGRAGLLCQTMRTGIEVRS